MKAALAALIMALALANASAIVFSTNWTVGATVPDNNPSGLADTRTVSGLTDMLITDVSVNLNLTGGWNGDLFAYLTHGSGFVVLLDRVGYNNVGPLGYGDAGMNVTFTSSATANIHDYGGLSTFSSPPSGNWLPDNSAITVASPGSLASFAGLDPNGTWTLFVADLSGGSISTLAGWGLDLNLVAIPEVETYVAAALAGFFGAFWLNRQIWGRKQRA